MERRDVVVVGGGPAGLAAALVLARCRLAIEVFDSGHYRNERSPALHGFLGHDGVAPAELRARGRAELSRYGVQVSEAVVEDARCRDGHPEVEVANGWIAADALLIATGVEDRLPAVDGVERFFGRGVYHCPYCDGWEARDGRILALGRGAAGAGLAMLLRTTWSARVMLLTDGPARLSRGDRERIERLGIPVESTRLARVAGGERFERVELRDGRVLEGDALFFAGGQHQRSRLATRLGCAMNRKGTLRAGRNGRSNVPGVWVAGDASLGPQLASVAVAEGVMAAYDIHQTLHHRSIASLGRHAREEIEGGLRAPAGIVLP